MELILKQDVQNLGFKDDVVTVKNGYGRNYLIPSKLAIEASPSNLKQREEKVKQQAKKEAKLLFLLSPAVYTVAIIFSFFIPMVSIIIFVITPLVYLIPNKLDKHLP